MTTIQVQLKRSLINQEEHLNETLLNELNFETIKYIQWHFMYNF